jgi:hypothetical protein
MKKINNLTFAGLMLVILTFPACNGNKEKDNQCATYQAEIKACQTTYDNCIKAPTTAFLNAVDAFQKAIIACEGTHIAAKAACGKLKGAQLKACVIAADKAYDTCIDAANKGWTQAFQTYTAAIAKCQADKDACERKVRADHKECLDSTE